MAARKRLGTVVSRSALAARILERAGATATVELDWLEAEISDARRFNIVAALKELEAAGAGTFVVGRRGRKSHFVWDASALAASAPAAALPQPATAGPSQGTPRNGEREARQLPPLLTLHHVFHLRPGLVTTVDLPADITKAEVERLCGFLHSIPFD